MSWLVYSWCPKRGECAANAARYKNKRRRLREAVIDAPSGNDACRVFRDMFPDQRNQFIDFESFEDNEDDE